MKEVINHIKKTNSDLLYVKTQSNHPKVVVKHILMLLKKRLNNISCNKNVFDNAKGEYERALKNSGHIPELKFEKANTNTTLNKKNRKRKILWYNPPYNRALKTNFGRKFLNLIRKHFPLGHLLYPIINKNNVKISYSTTTNMKRVIQNHNKKILNNTNDQAETTTKLCSCPSTKKDKCPLQNKCLTKGIVYKATVKKSNKFYIGVTEGDFKTRLANHKQSFRNETHKNATALSQHIWEIKENPEPDIKWEILSKAKPRIAASPYCFLCVEEKWHILKNNNNPNCLNKRSELTHRCVVFHRSRHKLNKKNK